MYNNDQYEVIMNNKFSWWFNSLEEACDKIIQVLIYMNNVYSAIILSAVLFALFHVNPAQIPGAFILGLITGYIVYRTKSIFYSFFVHAIYNSLCCLQYVAIGYESKTIDLVNGNWYIYLLLAISSLGIGYFVVKTMNFKLSLIKK